MELKQGTINIANSDKTIVLEVASRVSLPIKQGEESKQASPFTGAVELNQQQAVMLYLSAHGAIQKLKLQQGAVELLASFSDRVFRLRLTNYASLQRTLYLMSSQVLLDFIFLLARSIPRPIHYFHPPNAVIDVDSGFLSVSTPQGYAVLKGDTYKQFRFYTSEVIEGSDGRFAFGLEGVSFGENRLLMAGRTFSVVREMPLLGRKVNEFLYMLHLLMKI